MNRFKLSILHGFQSLSLSLEKVAALQFFRHPPVRSVNLGIFSHLPFKEGGIVCLLPLLKGGFPLFVIPVEAGIHIFFPGFPFTRE